MIKPGIPRIVWLYAVLCTTVGVGVPYLAYTTLARFRILPLLGLGQFSKRSSKVKKLVFPEATISRVS